MKLEPSTRYGGWSGAQVEGFLSQTRSPLRLSFRSRGGPLIVPVWFEFHSDCFWSCSPNESLLVRALRENPEVAFDVSTNDIPYRGVRGRGLADCAIAPDKSGLEALLERYVGADNSLARWLLNRTGDEAVIRIDITWLTSWDFSDRMSGISKISARIPGVSL